jgi:hypothetical protein
MAADAGLIPGELAETVRSAYRDYRRMQHCLDSFMRLNGTKAGFASRRIAPGKSARPASRESRRCDRSGHQCPCARHCGRNRCRHGDQSTKKARPGLAVVGKPVVRAGDGDRGTRVGVRGAYGMPPDDIAAVFEDMLAVENLTVDRAAAVGQALVWYRQGLDFSDALHLAQSGLCSGLATFDARFVKTARRLGLDPQVSAPG